MNEEGAHLHSARAGHGADKRGWLQDLGSVLRNSPLVGRRGTPLGFLSMMAYRRGLVRTEGSKEEAQAKRGEYLQQNKAIQLFTCKSLFT